MILIEHNKLKSIQLNGIYKDFAEVLGIDMTIQIFNYYKGLQITLPTRLLSKEFVEQKVKEEYDGKNCKALARKYEYSERWIRKMLSED